MQSVIDMRNVINILVVAFISILLTACSSGSGRRNHIDLYQGIPIESLSVDKPPVNEEEAIQRADKALSKQKALSKEKALSEQNIDLALYEYIRSLSFADAKQQDSTLFNIGRLHYSRSNLTLAETAYLRSLQFNPNNVDSLNQLGVIYNQSGEVEKGITYFLKAINADQIALSQPENVIDTDTIKDNVELLTQQQVTALFVTSQSPIESYIGLGTMFDTEGRHEIAKSFYEKALQIDPKSSKGLFDLGLSHYTTGNYDLAKRFMSSALQYEPKNTKMANQLALTHIKLDEPVMALNVFMRSMKAPEALHRVGYLLLSQGNPEAAVFYLQQAKNKSPADNTLINKTLNRAQREVEAKKKLAVSAEEDNPS